MRRFRPAASLAASLAAGVWVSGCTVGPDFHKPLAPDVSGYTGTPLSATSGVAGVSGGAAQTFVSGRDIPGDWWTLFHSKALNALIEQALKNSPDIAAGQAALRAAHENVLAQQGAYYPGMSGGFSATRQQTSAQVQPTPDSGALTFDLYVPQVSVSYTPDVFGLNRRTVESLSAQSEQARFALLATQLTLTANVAAAAVQVASLRAQIEATRNLIDINTKMTRLLSDQYDEGYVALLDLTAQKAQLAQVVATLPPLLKQLSQQEDLLAYLSGTTPGAALPDTIDLSGLELPGELPVSLPSQLVEQRPDVRQAEENMHSASALIGVAVANRLPNIALTADAGSMALEFGQIFSSGAGIWGIGAAITQPIFDGGILQHREQAAKATYDQAAAQYRGAVLAAFQNVADSLNAVARDADTLKAASESATLSETSLNIAQRQANAGYTNGLALLNAEQAYQQARINFAQAEASRFSDTVALFQALGGGWWNRSDTPKAETP